MKRFKLCVLVLLLLMCGCGQNDSRLYVKNVAISKTADEYRLTVVYYDFSQREETYETRTYSDKDIYRLAVKAMSNNSYNFRLCDTVFLSPELFTEDINKAVYLINSLRISPSANLVFYTGGEELLAKDSGEDIVSPLYNLSSENSAITGSVTVIDDDGKTVGMALIKEGQLSEILDKLQMTVLNMVTNSADIAQIAFHENSLWADIEDVITGFYIDESTLNIVMDISVKERKGMGSSIQSRQIFDRLLRTEISNTIYDLYENIHINQIYNLHWYCRQKGTDCEKIKVWINIK